MLMRIGAGRERASIECCTEIKRRTEVVLRSIQDSDRRQFIVRMTSHYRNVGKVRIADM